MHTPPFRAVALLMLCSLAMATDPGWGAEFRLATTNGEACISTERHGSDDLSVWDHVVVQPDGTLTDGRDCSVPLNDVASPDVWLTGASGTRVALESVGKRASKGVDRLMVRVRGEEVLLLRLGAAPRAVEARVRTTNNGLVTVWAAVRYQGERDTPSNRHEVFWVINPWTGSGRLVANKLVMQELPHAVIGKVRGLTDLQVLSPITNEDPEPYEMDARILLRHAKTLRKLNIGGAELQQVEAIATLTQLRSIRLYEWENYAALKKLPLLEEVSASGDAREAIRALLPHIRLTPDRPGTRFTYATESGELCEAAFHHVWHDAAQSAGTWEPTWVLDSVTGERSVDGVRCTVPTTVVEPSAWVRSRTAKDRKKRPLKDAEGTKDPTLGITIEGKDLDVIDLPYMSRGISVRARTAGQRLVLVEFDTEYGASLQWTNVHSGAVLIDRDSGKSLVLENHFEATDDFDFASSQFRRHLVALRSIELPKVHVRHLLPLASVLERIHIDGRVRGGELVSQMTRLTAVDVGSIDDASGLLSLEPLRTLRIRKRGKLTDATLAAIRKRHPNAQLP